VASRAAVEQAGDLGWNNVDDRDGIKGPLVNVDAF
jgi:hypothetical protein